MKAPPAPEREAEAENDDVRAPWDPPIDREERQEWYRARKNFAARVREVRTLLGTAAPASPSTTSSTTVNPQQWTFIGPQPIGTNSNPWAGSVLNLAIDPHNPATIYAGTYVGKLWKTTDSGSTWLPMSDAGPLVDIQWIAVDPVALNTLYALNAGSIYKSADGGSTWTELRPVDPDPSCSGEAFAIHPSVSGTWLVSEFCSASPQTSLIYKTANAGATWTKQATVAGEIDKLEFNASSPNYAYAAGFATAAVVFQISTDTGATWSSAIGSGSTALPQAATNKPNVVSFASAPSNPKTIYLQVDSEADPDTISMFKTADGGVTWNGLSSFLTTKQSPRTPGLTAVDPTNPNLVFAGAINLERSTDGGATWVYMTGTTTADLHSDNHAMVFTPDGSTAYESNDGGVWMSTNFRSGFVNWTSLNQTFGTAEVHAPLGMDPTNPNRAFAGLQDNQTIIYSGALAWAFTGMIGDGFGSTINPANPNIVYADTNAGGIFRSTAGGATGSFSALPNTPIMAGKILMDFTTPTTLYAFADTSLFQTMDGGNTWPAFGPANKGAVEDVAVAPSDSNTVVAIESGAIPWVTKNAQSGAAAAWTGGLPDKTVASTTSTQRIVIDPADPNKLYGLQGNGLLGAPLVVSGDEGMSWRAVDFGPNVVGIPRDLVVDPGLPDTLYVRGKNSASDYYRARRLGSGDSYHGAPAQRSFAHRGELRLPGDGERNQFRAGLGRLDEREPASHIVLRHHTIDGGSSHERDRPLHGVLRVRQYARQRRRALQSDLRRGGPDDLPQWRPECGRSGVGDFGFPDEFLRRGTIARHVRDSAWYAAGGPPAIASPPFPTTLGGAQVLVNGTAAPIAYVSDAEIDFVVPWETAGDSASIAVVSGGTTSNTVTAPIRTAPQIFAMNQPGWGQGAVLITGTAAIAAPMGAYPGSRPVARGEYISIFTTGLGAVQNPPADGAVAVGLSPSAAQPVVRIGCPQSNGSVGLCDVTTQQYSGIEPGHAGLYQVCVRIPTIAMSGSAVPLQITFAAGAARPSNIVTIAVQ